MQCQSYFPVYHSQYDLNADANSTARPMYNGTGTFGSGHYNNYVSPSPVAQGPFAFGKEFLRQTMLMHEATFKDQIQELHRLYRRQKELMGEIKSKEMKMNHLHSEAQCSNSISRSGQNAQHGLQLFNPHCWPSTTSIDNFQSPLYSSKGQTLPLSPNVLQYGGTLNNLHFPESKGKKIGRKFLDLELPAEEYIDEEGESLEDAQYHEAPTSTGLSSNKFSKFVAETDAVASSDNRLSDFTLPEGTSSPSSFAQTTNHLADLNEPPTTSYLENNDCKSHNGGSDTGPGISEINADLFHLGTARLDHASDTRKALTTQCDEAISVSPASSQRKPFSNLVKNSSVVQALPCLTNQLLSKGAKPCSRIKRSIHDKFDASSRCSPSSDLARSLKSSYSESKLKESMVLMSSLNSDCLKHVKGLHYIDLNSAVLENAEYTPGTSSSKAFTEVDKVGKGVILSESGLSQISLSREDVSLKQTSSSSVYSVDGETTRKSKRCRLIDINMPCDPSIEDDLVEQDYKNSGQKILNSCMTEDGLSSKSSSLDRITLEIDLEAPPSPEVEERPPPRGDSEDNHPEVLHQVSTLKDDGDPTDKLVKVAAEAIVSMSSFKSQPCSQIWDLQKSEASDSGTLKWFAGLIESLSNDLVNDFGTPGHVDTCSLDDFEVLTLNLTEMKEEEYWCKDNVQVESVTCPMPLPDQMRKGRRRRSKRKDFQREVLPSLASLSRYEVTEDIQMIEGLMEAAGTPLQFSKTRRACRTGRKPRAAKQQTSTFDVPDLKDGPLISWGKVNRRPRGRRSPASPYTVLSKWLEHMT